MCQLVLPKTDTRQTNSVHIRDGRPILEKQFWDKKQGNFYDICFDNEDIQKTIINLVKHGNIRQATRLIDYSCGRAAVLQLEDVIDSTTVRQACRAPSPNAEATNTKIIELPLPADKRRIRSDDFEFKSSSNKVAKSAI
ncbi:hypothetical protein GJ496_007430 [Pomphorhynchus laevis]|nr:hypothetical protein GJ496_007430 [Pomphorhynchus laevis]